MEEILKILEKDAKTTPTRIASMTGKTVSEVEEIIKRAEENKTIFKYKAIINWNKIKDEVLALVEVKLQPQRNVGFDAIAKRISRFPETYSVYVVSGAYDLAVLVKGKTLQEISAFITQKLAPLDSVQSTVTHFLLKRYKEDGEILECERETRRIPLTF